MSADLLDDRRLRHVEVNQSSLSTHKETKVIPEVRKTKLKQKEELKRTSSLSVILKVVESIKATPVPENKLEVKGSTRVFYEFKK